MKVGGSSERVSIDSLNPKSNPVSTKACGGAHEVFDCLLDHGGIDETGLARVCRGIGIDARFSGCEGGGMVDLAGSSNGIWFRLWPA